MSVDNAKRRAKSAEDRTGSNGTTALLEPSPVGDTKMLAYVLRDGVQRGTID